MKLIVKPQDQRYLFIIAESENDKKTLKYIEKHFNKIPLYQLLPSFKGIPTPIEIIYRYSEQVLFCGSGLWHDIFELLTVSQVPYTTNIDASFKYTDFYLTYQEFCTLVNSWNLNITPRDYQLKAAYLILKYKNSLSGLATRAGKTLIFYIVSRVAKKVLNVKKILLIVPSIQLVKQGIKDLQEYAEYFHCTPVWGLQNGLKSQTEKNSKLCEKSVEMCSLADVTIGTFQSLIKKLDKRSAKFDPDFFNGFQLVCIDEAHKAPCNSIYSILNIPSFKDLTLKFGFTGTLPKKDTTEYFACCALVGAVLQTITPNDLINKGFLAKPIIYQHRISYPVPEDVFISEAEKILIDKTTNKLPTAILQCKNNLLEKLSLNNQTSYKKSLLQLLQKTSRLHVLENNLLQQSQERLEYIKDLVTKIEYNDKNIIVFAHNTSYINAIYNFLKENTKKTYFKITGSTTLNNRTKIVDMLDNTGDCVLIASYGCMSTGITFQNMHTCILAQSFKSDIILNQSLGRLMINNNKSAFDVHDLIDVFETKKLYRHAVTKLKSYKENSYEVHIVETKL